MKLDNNVVTQQERVAAQSIPYSIKIDDQKSNMAKAK